MTSTVPTKRPLCLVTDDDDDVRGVIRIQLIDLGLDVIEATNGREALQSVEAHSLDYLFADIDMPEITGLELLERISERFPDKMKNMKCLIVTGRSQWEQDAPIAGRVAGCLAGWLRKPFDDSELRRVINKAR